VYDRDPIVAADEPTPDDAATRRVMRDVGGLPVAGGGRIRTGRLFRISGQLASAEELDELGRAGVIAIVDLRGEDEDRTVIQRWAAANGATYRHEPIPAASGTQLGELARSSATADVVHEAMLETYRFIVDQHGRELANTLAVIADGTPAGFGCAAGRDRTGIMASLLYDLLGVAEADIVATYTGHAPPPEQMRLLARSHFGLPDGEPLPPGLEVLMTVHPEWITATLEHIRSRYGDVTGYLLEHGLPRAAPAALERLLVQRVDM
jgi:protein-tyrosine phosphatase